MIKEYKARNRYIERLKPFIAKDIIKVIVGQRRVGKSYLMFQVMDLLRGKKIIYINKELHEFDHIKNYKDLLLHIKKEAAGRKGVAVFIDEIQDIEYFEKALRSLQAEGNYDIYCTGSNAKLLSGELATYLSGRYVQQEVFTLSYPEFLEFHNLKETQESFLKYVKYGGLPYLIHLELSDDVVYEYLSNIYNTILFKDIVARYGVRNTAFLERLIEFLADNVGSLVSAKKISDFLKSQQVDISVNVVINYLSYLAASFFIFDVPRSEVVGKKIFEINNKYYFGDLGLRHCISGYRQIDINKILENLVFLHLKILGFDITIGKISGNKEIDFVCEKGKEKLYVQVTYLLQDQAVREREFGNLLRIKDNYRKMVISMDELVEPGAEYKGIEHWNIRNFLANFI